ncbi:hypothetical protein BG004_002638 [Podila humilis]|nr:hypothetical protein BG004_002638 [Podila humilis]
MRCRVYRIAKDKFGLEDTDEKEAWIQAEIEKRKGMLLLRHSRKAEWKGMSLNNGSGSNVSDGGNSGGLGGLGSDVNKYPSGASTSPFFLYGSAPQITGYDAQGQPIYSTSQSTESYKDTSMKDGDRTFIELLKSEHVPRRRRSRQALNANVTKAQSFHQTIPSNAPESNIVTSEPVDDHYAPFGLMKGTLSSQSLMGLGQGLSANAFGSSVSLSQRGPPAMKKRRNRKQRSISEKKSMFRRRVVAGTSPTSLGNTTASGLYDNSYLESGMYQGVYQTRSLSQALLLNKSAHDRPQSSQDAMETIVNELELSQHPKQTSTTSSIGSSSSGLYGDRTELSGWIDWQNPQSAVHSHSNNSSMNGSRQYPFPEMTIDSVHPLRDRKGLAKAAGIKIDIPAHQQGQHSHMGMNPDWIMMDVSNHGGTDDMVGGSATSVASSANSQLKSPLSAASSMQSPMLAFGTNTTNDTSSSPSINKTSPNSVSSGTKARVVHKAASHEMFSGIPSSFGQNPSNGSVAAQYPYQSFYGAGLSVGGHHHQQQQQQQQHQQHQQQQSLAQQAQVRSLAMARTQGLNTNSTTAEIDYFTTLVLPGAGDISVSSAGNNNNNNYNNYNVNSHMSTTTAAGSSVPNYLAKQQINLRRHSTQLSNLSTCIPPAAVNQGMNVSSASSTATTATATVAGATATGGHSLLPEIESLIAESDQERAREQAAKKQQQISVPIGPGTMAGTFYPFPTTAATAAAVGGAPAAPNNSNSNTFSGIYTPFTFGDAHQTGGLPSLPDRVLGSDRSKLITPAHPHTMGDIMLTVGGGDGEGMDIVSVEHHSSRKPNSNGVDVDDDRDVNGGAMMNEDTEEYHLNSSQMSAAAVGHHSNAGIVVGSSSNTTMHTSGGPGVSIITNTSTTGPGSIGGGGGGSEMERSGSAGWWPGGGSQHSMASTPTTSTTNATVLATSQSNTTLSSSLSSLSNGGSGGGASIAATSNFSGTVVEASSTIVGEPMDRTASTTSGGGNKNGTGSTMATTTTTMSSSGKKSNGGSFPAGSGASSGTMMAMMTTESSLPFVSNSSNKNDNNNNKSNKGFLHSEKDTGTSSESAKKPPLSLSSGFSKQHKKSGSSSSSSSSSLGSLFTSSISSMTASLSGKKIRNRFSNSSLNQQQQQQQMMTAGEVILKEGGSGKSTNGSSSTLTKMSKREKKHSLSPPTSSSSNSTLTSSSNTFRPGHPRRSSSILDEFAEVMLNIATKKP